MSNLPANPNRANLARRDAGLILSDAIGGDWALVDCSGSMACETPEPGMTRIACVRQALAPMRQMRAIAFGWPRGFDGADILACEVPIDDLPEPTGGTPMEAAMGLLIRRRPDYTLILSDGRVNKPSITLERAAQVTGIIDALYIGPDDPEAEHFMQELARAGHGRFQRFDLSQKAIGFTQAVQAMLPPPSSEGVIAL